MCMRRIILSLSFVLLAVSLWGQRQSTNGNQEAAILRAKNVLVSSLDRSLPKVSLDFFLKYEAGGSPIQWEVNGCGEQPGSPASDHGSDPPMCAEADFAKHQTDVSVLVSVGTFKRGPIGVPAFFSVKVNGPGGRSLRLRRLGDLPKELNRPAPRMPRDLPVPISASSE
jgi:hypothetical protein